MWISQTQKSRYTVAIQRYYDPHLIQMTVWRFCQCLHPLTHQPHTGLSRTAHFSMPHGTNAVQAINFSSSYAGFQAYFLLAHFKVGLNASIQVNLANAPRDIIVLICKENCRVYRRSEQVIRQRYPYTRQAIRKDGKNRAGLFSQIKCRGMES